MSGRYVVADPSALQAHVDEIVGAPPIVRARRGTTNGNAPGEAEIMRPSDVDSLPSSPGEPEGWHVREKTSDGYPLMGSSPAERAEAEERMARIKAEAMREHRFVGDGPYCQGRISFAPIGGPDTGWIVGWSECGYPLDMHSPELQRSSLEEAWGEAHREAWARRTVAAAGKGFHKERRTPRTPASGAEG